MKKYLLFMYDSYYPCGGFNDFVCDFNSLNEIDYTNIIYYDYVEIADSDRKVSLYINIEDKHGRYEINAEDWKVIIKEAYNKLKEKVI